MRAAVRREKEIDTSMTRKKKLTLWTLLASIGAMSDPLSYEERINRIKARRRRETNPKKETGAAARRLKQRAKAGKFL